MRRYIAMLILLLLPQLSMAAAGIADVADNDPGLFLIMLIALLALVFMVVAGTFIILFIAGILMLLVGAGILSLSVFAGWYHNSVGKGINTFLNLSFITAGIIAALLLLLVLDIFNVQAVTTTSFCVSVIAAGGIAGWICIRITKQVLQLLINKLNNPNP